MHSSHVRSFKDQDAGLGLSHVMILQALRSRQAAMLLQRALGLPSRAHPAVTAGCVTGPITAWSGSSCC